MKKILFVCMGNICRSPAAEAILKKKLQETNLDHKISVDSAGTIDYHTGELPDPRMIRRGSLRGYRLVHRARQFSPQKDFINFDLILTMDEQNYSTIVSLDKGNKFFDKVKRLTDYCKQFNIDSVPDPYYGGDKEFDLVIDILEDAIDELLIRLTNA